MATRIDTRTYIGRFAASPLADWAGFEPWHLTVEAETIVETLLAGLGADFQASGGIAVHGTAEVEAGATLKAPAIVGPGCFLAAGAYLRGGVWLEADCGIGPGSELKSCFAFRGARLAHFNFVGDSLLGEEVNLEAGSIIANHRNERDDKRIRVTGPEGPVDTGVEKFGALVGDGCRIGANAVIAPGALLGKGTVVPRLGHLDQEAG